MAYMKLIKILLPLFFLISAYQSYGQIGLKLGVHSFDLSSPKDIILDDERALSFTSANLGFQGGLFLNIRMNNWFIQPRAMFNSIKVNYRLDGENGSVVENVQSEKFTNLDIPLVVGREILFFKIYAGPVLHIHLNSVSDLMVLENYKSNFEDTHLGYRAGLGIPIGNASISVEYEGNLTQFGNHISIGGRNFSFRETPTRLIINLGINLSNSKDD